MKTTMYKSEDINQKLLEKESQLENILKFSSNEIIFTDTEFNILFQNNKILGQKYAGADFVEILKKNKQTDALETLENFVKTKKNQVTFRFIVEKKKYTKTSVSKIYTRKKHTGYLIVMDDITEEIKAEQQRDAFIETLSHDLKTPVSAEKRALELLYDGSFGELTESQKDIVKEILNSSKYMIRMTDNILTRYKLDNGRCRIIKQPHSIKQTIQTCVESLQYLFEAAGQTVKVSSQIDDAVLDYDEEEIKKVLCNVIANASEYSPRNSVVYINLDRKDNNVEISVRDEGVGISEEKLKEIFDEHKTIESRFKKIGSGLGVFITKKIVEAHRGSVFIHTEPNHGTNFVILLPLEKQESLIK